MRGGKGRRPGGPRHRLRVQPRRRPAAARPALGVPAGRRARAVPGGRPRGLRLARQRLARACRWRARSSTSCTSARSRPRAPSTARSSTSTTWPSSASTLIELMPVAEFAGRPRLGLRRRRPVRPAPRLRRPGRPEAAGRRRHARGLGVVLDVVYNHLGPAGNYLPEFGPYFSRPAPDHLGRRRQLRRPGQRRGPPVRHRQRPDCGCATTTSTGCASTPCTRSSTTPPPTSSRSWPPRWRLAAHAGRPLFVVAESDLNDPRLVRGREAGGFGLDAAWADDLHHALHAALTGEQDGYYEDFGPLPLLAKALRQAGCTTASTPRTAAGARPLAGRAGRAPVRGLHPEPRPGRQPRRGRAQLRPDERGPAEGGRRPPAHRAVRADAVPGRGVGRGTPFQFFTDHADPGLGRRSARAGGRSSPTSAGIPPTSPTPRIRRRSSAPGWTGPTGAGPSRRPAGLVSRADQPAPPPARIGRSAARPRRDRIRSSVRVADRPARAGRRSPPISAAGGWTFPASPATALLAGSDPRVVRSRQGIALPPDTVAIVTEADVS